MERNYKIVQTNQRKPTKYHKPQPNSITRKEKPENKRTKHQKVERQTQNKQFDFREKDKIKTTKENTSNKNSMKG